jgi:8-oxo-dGTP pyrophosphatase MutT (NUDIX family)
VNGLVRRAEGLHVWVAVRARNKAIAPGKLDNIVAGGISAGLTPAETLVKEAAEEAGIPPDLAATARPAGRIGYTMAWHEPRQARGMRRDTLHVFDLDLPEGFVPRPNDGEVERFELWPIGRVFAVVRRHRGVQVQRQSRADRPVPARGIDPTQCGSGAAMRGAGSGRLSGACFTLSKLRRCILCRCGGEAHRLRNTDNKALRQEGTCPNASSPVHGHAPWPAFGRGPRPAPRNRACACRDADLEPLADSEGDGPGKRTCAPLGEVRRRGA